MQENGEIMFYREQTAVEIYEKKFSLEDLNWMYQEGRLRFPRAKNSRKYQNTVSRLIDAIQVGIPMPVIYVSELQNGDFLILESKEWLLALLSYLQGNFYIPVDEMSTVFTQCFFYELNQETPRLASMILRTIFFFRIIDYHTPKYLHMETALFHEEWAIEQEQDIRNILYKKHGIEALNAISRKARQICIGMPSQKIILKEYEILYMLLFWGIHKRLLPLETQINYSEQELLEITISDLDKNYYDWESFLNVIDDMNALYHYQIDFPQKSRPLFTSHYKNRKVRAKAYGLALCLFDMCQCKYENSLSALDRFLCVNTHMREIESLPVTLNSIYSYLKYLWEDLL
ncbi:MAG: hypothetical protein NC341_04415 [Blautia sp.]|nr:hypothetical protein [Blautia sp.]MCM1200880.1 hypothetical protein [Bacteroides fragilis]